MDERALLHHLYRRAGFGPRPGDLDAAVARGYEATVDYLLDYESLPEPDLERPKTTQVFPPNLEEIGGVENWWLNRMLLSDRTLEEKLTLLWHDHFAVSVAVVKQSPSLLGYIDMLRRNATGNFGTFLWEVTADPAMLVYLDNARNRKEAPNENYAREVMELFTMGVGNYTETDVSEAARALTGLTIERGTGQVLYREEGHDAGMKTILGETAAFDPTGLVELLARQPATHTYVTAKLHWYLVGTTPDAASNAALAETFAADLEIKPVVRQILLSDAFKAASFTTVRSPLDWMIGTMRAAGAGPIDLDDAGPDAPGQPGRRSSIVRALYALGQVPLSPPNVGGWSWGKAWLTTATYLFRTNFATQAAARNAAMPGASIDAVAAALGIDGTDAATRAKALLGENPDSADALAFLLASPEYQLF